MEPNYGAHKYLAAYNTLFHGSGKLYKDEGLDIARDDYAKGYSIYAYDLTPDMSDSSHFNLSKDGSVRIDLQFSVALANTVNVIIYGEFEHLMEINREKNVIFDYTA